MPIPLAGGTYKNEGHPTRSTNLLPISSNQRRRIWCPTHHISMATWDENMWKAKVGIIFRTWKDLCSPATQPRRYSRTKDMVWRGKSVCTSIVPGEHLPWSKGIMVAPSGLRASPRRRPPGSTKLVPLLSSEPSQGILLIEACLEALSALRSREGMKAIWRRRKPTGTNIWRHTGHPTRNHRTLSSFITQTKSKGRGWQAHKPTIWVGSCTASMEALTAPPAFPTRELHLGL